MIKLQIERILQEKRITKSAFANMLGIKKQNVNGVLETRNLDKIQEIAEVLGVDYLELIVERKEEQKPTINGFVELGGRVYKVTCREDLVNLINEIDMHSESNS